MGFGLTSSTQPTTYFIGNTAAKAINHGRDQDNKGDTLLGDQAAEDAIVFSESNSLDIYTLIENLSGKKYDEQ